MVRSCSSAVVGLLPAPLEQLQALTQGRGAAQGLRVSHGELAWRVCASFTSVRWEHLGPGSQPLCSDPIQCICTEGPLLPEAESKLPIARCCVG